MDAGNGWDPYGEPGDQRTRVVRRDGAVPDEPRIGQTAAGAPEQKEGLLEGISIPQVVAGAAAAATSMVLASKIGIAGSVIGAAVSSVVTVVSSQLYRRFLTAGARGIRRGREALAGRSPAAADAPSRGPVGRRDAADPAAAMVAPGAAGARGARVAPRSLRARAAAERGATQRKVIAFSIGAAVLAVALSAGAILAVTAGEGLGERTTPLFAPAQREADGADAAVDATRGDASASGTDEPAADDGPDEAGQAAGSAGAGGDTSDAADQGASDGAQAGDQAAGQDASTGSGGGASLDQGDATSTEQGGASDAQQGDQAAAGTGTDAAAGAAAGTASRAADGTRTV